ncbi:PAS domain-containing sensor histidine kinase [Mangrovibacillus cuniculi]|uniref:histidine kinase n=1 Tax=Mangrovibacillus cuniculi TaxID=2593652 RepID=A0A7S8HF75_9BACI|nr:PAS domain-containing sensor histidine kinase [Mangrovibacillus cuniculi]QPC46130.1 PAS domain S-box protein [Mangrovibacillus cuniculi]
MRDEVNTLDMDENLRVDMTVSVIRDVLNSVQKPTILINRSGNILMYNEAFTQFYNEEEYMLKETFLFQPLFQEHDWELYSYHLETSGSWQGTITLPIRQTAVRHHPAGIKKLTNTTYYTVTIRTSEWLLEEKGHMEQSVLSQLFSQAADHMLIIDKTGEVLEANESFLNKIQVSVEQLRKKGIRSFIPAPFHYKLDKAKNLLARNSNVRGEIPVLYPSGIRLIDFTISQNIVKGKLVVILRDITDRKLVEQKLKASELFFKDLFDEALDAILFWDPNGQIIRANKSALRMFECSMDEILQRNVTEFVYKKDERFDNILRTFRGNGAVRDELLFLMPNGELKQLEFTSKTHPIEGFNMTIFRNISERSKMEQALRRSEEKFRNIFEGTFEGMVLIDHNLSIIQCNTVASMTLNKDMEQLIKTPVRNLIPKDAVYVSGDEEHFSNMLIEGYANTVYLFEDKGQQRFIELSTKKDIMQEAHLTVIRDVTEKMDMLEQLRKSDTLNVVGELAAGIAHEIRNPMTALKGFIQLLEKSMAGQHQMYFQVISTELQRIETIITEFLILAKPQAVKFDRVNINDRVKETFDLMNAQALMHNVTMHCDLHADPLFIQGESNQLKQVLINFVKNAIEAMPSGGSLRLRTLVEHNEICIEIKDEGVGIPEDKIKKLGEPFYTTKERGTGLGLMVTLNIIKEHDGRMEVESSVGKGTIFKVFFKRSKHV